MPKHETTAPTRLISFSETCRRVGRSRWWIREAIAEGRFPRPVSITPSKRDFVEAEIESWIAERIAARDRNHAA